MNRFEEKKPSYRLRKLTVGLCSVTLLTIFANHTVLADEVSSDASAQTTQTTDSDKSATTTDNSTESSSTDNSASSVADTTSDTSSVDTSNDNTKKVADSKTLVLADTTSTTVDQTAAKASYDKIVADIKSKYQTDYDQDQFFSENGVTATKDLSDANNPKATITFADGIDHDGWETSIPFMRMADVDLSLFTFSNLGITPYNDKPTFSSTDDYKKLANDWSWMFPFTGGNGKGRTVTEQDLINITSVTMDTDTSTWDFTKYPDYKPYADSTVPNAEKFNEDIYKIMRGNGATITFRDGTSQHMLDSSFLIIDTLNLPASSFYNRGKDKGAWAKDIVLNVGDNYSQDDYIHFVKDLYGNIVDQEWEVAQNQIYDAAISDFTLLDSKTLQPISTEKAGAGTYVVHYNKDTQHKWDWSPKTDNWIVKDTKLEVAKDVTINKGTAVTPQDFLTDDVFKNPDYAKLEFETTPDVNTAGTSQVKIKITYGDGTTSEVTPNLTVNEYWLTPAEYVQINQNDTADFAKLVDQAKSSLPGETAENVEITNLDTSKLGSQTAHVKYTANGKTVETDVAVNVVPVDYSIIESTTVKQGTDLDAKTLVSDEGTYKDFELSDYDKTMPGLQTVTVTGTDTDGNKVSKTVKVTVVPEDYTVVEKYTAKEGEDLDVNKLVSSTGDYKDFTVSGYNKDLPGVQEVTVTGTDNAGNKASKTVKVTVVPEDYTVVEKYTAKEGEDLDVNKLVSSTGNYKDFTITGYDPNKAGEQVVTITGVTVNGDKSVKTIVVTVSPKKRDFTVAGYKLQQGEDLDVNKLVTDAGDYKDFTVEGYDPNKTGEQTVTVTGVDADGNKVSKTVVVTVEAKQEAAATDKKDKSKATAKTTKASEGSKTPRAKRTESKATAKKLPQTGENDTLALIAGSVTALVSVLGLAYKKEK
ncbi:MAG: Rib/alpha-like domain-containing protein [Lactobacillus sp.]|nr:Rib/alpha-like domain-containing protein [Lactobacillus sp.]